MWRTPPPAFYDWSMRFASTEAMREAATMIARALWSANGRQAITKLSVRSAYSCVSAVAVDLAVSFVWDNFFGFVRGEHSVWLASLCSK